MSQRLYVASRCGNPVHALDEGNVIAVCWDGPTPQSDAESYAKDETSATDNRSYVYVVQITGLCGFRIQKEVVSF